MIQSYDSFSQSRYADRLTIIIARKKKLFCFHFLGKGKWHATAYNTQSLPSTVHVYSFDMQMFRSGNWDSRFSPIAAFSHSTKRDRKSNKNGIADFHIGILNSFTRLLCQPWRKRAKKMIVDDSIHVLYNFTIHMTMRDYSDSHIQNRLEY